MFVYLDLLEDILKNGIDRPDRTGTGTRSVFGRQLRFDLRKGFPLLTTKKMPFKSIASELLWFLEGSTDERRLAEILYGKDRSELTDKKTIWTANANDPIWKPKAKFEGDLGRIYGAMWRDWRSTLLDNTGVGTGTSFEIPIWIDQIRGVIRTLKRDPYSRRHLVVAYNPGELTQQALPPCHVMFQFFVSNKRELSCMWTQRSVDVPLGLGFNIASYALLTHMIAQVVGFTVGDLIGSLGDCHLYQNQIGPVKEQLLRLPRELATLVLNQDIDDIDDFELDDMKLTNYHPHDKLDIPFSV